MNYYSQPMRNPQWPNWHRWGSFFESREVRTRMKIVSLIILLCTAMGLTGATSAIKFSPQIIHTSMRMKGSWFLSPIAPHEAMLAMSMGGESTVEKLATHDEKINELDRQNTLGEAERSDIRASLNALQLQEINNFDREEKARIDDFNKLATRMDIAETRVVTAGMVVSTIFSLALALLLFFHMDEKWSRGKRNRDRLRRQEENLS